MDTLQKIYYSTSSGLGGRDRLYKAAKLLDPTVTYKLVNEFLSKQETQQLFTSPQRQTLPLMSYAPFRRMQIDLLDVRNESPRLNNGVTYIFLAIDTYTRFTFAYPLKRKSTAECSRALLSLIGEINSMEHSTRSTPRRGYPKDKIATGGIHKLDSDNELAFVSDEFTKICQDHGIFQNFSRPNDHRSLGIIDRFCRTFRSLLAKYKVAFQTERYVDAVPDLISNYNDSKHRILKVTPTEAVTDNSHYDEVRDSRVDAAKPSSPLSVGDKVRLRLKRTVFEKGTGAKFTKEVHIIESIDRGLTGDQPFRRGVYHVSERKLPYRRDELLPITEVETNPFLTQEEVKEGKVQEEEKKVTDREKKIQRKLRREGIL